MKSRVVLAGQVDRGSVAVGEIVRRRPRQVVDLPISISSSLARTTNTRSGCGCHLGDGIPANAGAISPLNSLPGT